ncbi:MerR family transcriptional regulator [Gottfriedia acidiceleris]|uniref:MerR family transcriptional regulator n=1 Tax=Gottfriedia acidiceleris TaxID=371036 RepID=UPI00101C0976|nr:MerR family transcriptional regulator [Gottfriedia acidiceleris]
MIDGDVILTSTQIREQLELKPSTFRKYQDILENVGYKIKKNSRGHRQYSSYDVLIFEKLIELSKHDGMTLEKSARMIIEQTNRLIPHTDMIDEEKSLILTEHLIHISNEHQLQTIEKLMNEMEKRLYKKMDLQHKEVLKQREKQTSILLEEWREQRKHNQQLLLETAATQEKNSLVKKVKEKIEELKKWYFEI